VYPITQNIANINNACGMGRDMQGLFTLMWFPRHSLWRIIFAVSNDSLYIGAGKH